MTHPTDTHTHTIVNAGVPLANLSRFDGISSEARLTDMLCTLQRLGTDIIIHQQQAYQVHTKCQNVG